MQSLLSFIAGLIEAFTQMFDVIALVGLPVTVRPHSRPRKLDHVVRHIQILDPQKRCLP